MNALRPVVGVSQCLLGAAVRYDGESKGNTLILEELSQIFELLPVCPEVEAGLSIPRPPVQLTASIENPKLTGRDDPGLDVTQLLQDFCVTRIPELSSLSGFIFKSRSPSCGLNSTPVFIEGKCVTETQQGIFARNLCRAYPELPVIEETALEDEAKQQSFINAVRKKHDTMRITDS